MALDESTRRLAFLLQRDLRRLVERERARRDRGEEVRYDTVSRMATWETRRGDVIGRWYGEVIASYVIKDRILRWAWAGRALLSGTLTGFPSPPAVASSTHSEAIFREGQSRTVPQLSQSVVGELDEQEAGTLARLGVLVSRGEGLSITAPTDGEITYVGLYDSPRPREGDVVDPSRYSVPPPPVTVAPANTASNVAAPAVPPPPAVPSIAQSPTPQQPQRGSTPPAPYRSLPPITEIYGPRSPPKKSSAPPAGTSLTQSTAPPPPLLGESQDKKAVIREPARGLFVPIATTVLSTVSKTAPGFQQALFVLYVHADMDRQTPSRRLMVMLAVVDKEGVLRAIDPTDDLIEAAARMVEADRADGNGPWRKLSARITPKADGGATLNVDVI